MLKPLWWHVTQLGCVNRSTTPHSNCMTRLTLSSAHFAIAWCVKDNPPPLPLTHYQQLRREDLVRMRQDADFATNLAGDRSSLLYHFTIADMWVERGPIYYSNISLGASEEMLGLSHLAPSCNHDRLRSGEERGEVRVWDGQANSQRRAAALDRVTMCCGCHGRDCSSSGKYDLVRTKVHH